METKSLGDKLPSELADHLQALAPDISSLYEVVFLDSLPSNARDAALQQTGLAAMAAAADQVVLGNRALASSNAAVNAVTYDADSLDLSTPLESPVQAVAAVSRHQPSGVRPGPRQPSTKPKDLCPIHARSGKEAFKCLRPSYCKMRDVVRPFSPPTSQASGNGKAGGR